MEGSRKRISQRTETNIIITEGENIASRIYRRKGGSSCHEDRGKDAPNSSTPAHDLTGVGRADWAAKEWGQIV